jgi:hypothetical protein
MIPVKEFSCAADLQAHYRALNARFFPSRPKPRLMLVAKVEPEPVATVDLSKEIETFLDSLPEPEEPAENSGFVPEPGPFGAKKIIAHVAQKNGFTSDDILGKVKSSRLVVARWEAIKLVQEMNPKWSLPKIGRIFKRDHTSILHALREMGARS